MGGTKIHQAQTGLFLREPPHLSAEVPAGRRAGCPATNQTHSPIKRCCMDRKPDSYRRGRHWGGSPLPLLKGEGLEPPSQEWEPGPAPARHLQTSQFPPEPPAPVTTWFLPDTPKRLGSCQTPCFQSHSSSGLTPPGSLVPVRFLKTPQLLPDLPIPVRYPKTPQLLSDPLIPVRPPDSYQIPQDPSAPVRPPTPVRHPQTS